MNAALDPISWTRRVVHDLLANDAELAELPLYLWLPGSADDLPAVVVGRPDLSESSEHRALVEVVVPVYVLGRTLRDDEAQAQLDSWADVVTSVLWAPHVEGMTLRLGECRATVTPIADRETPSYTARAIASMTYC